MHFILYKCLESESESESQNCVVLDSFGLQEMIGWGTSLYNTLWCMYITNYYYRLVIGLFWEREFMIYEWLT